MFGVKRPAQQPDDDRSQVSETDSGPNGTSPSDTSHNGSSPSGSPAKPAAATASAANGSPAKPAANGSAANGSAATGSKPAAATAAVAEPGAPPAGSADGQPPGSGSEPADPGSSSRRPSVRFIALGTAAVAALTAGVVFAVVQASPSQPGGAGSGQGRAAGPIRLTAISPASQATGVDGADPIVVTFSGTMSPSSPKPTITPSVPGTWTATGTSLIFTPTTPFQPDTKVTVTVPAGTSGVHSAGGGLLTSRVRSQFTTAGYSQAGLAVLLAQQGYLPMTWGPGGSGHLASVGMQSEAPAAQTPQGIAYAPPVGTFTWQPGYPSTLQAQWRPDQGNVLLAGAVMAFESEHNMKMSGNLTPQLWKALFVAQQRGERNANGYTYAIASKGSPEKLTIWHNGQVVQSSLANTGIPVSPTVDGTFPVFERLRFQIMQGTNPDGSHYADPVQYVAYFNGGDAVHYFPRGSYGSEQSLGCVELDLADAAHAWPYLTYGSLVSVVN